MRNDWKEFLMGMVAGAAGVGVLIGMLFLGCEDRAMLRGRMAEKRKAIDANVARWVVDAKTGEIALEYGCEKNE